MADERRLGRSDGETTPRPGPTRRRLLATAGATALLAGCTDTISDDEDGANVADPETLEENDENETETETDEETETETENETETEEETETDETENETETEEETETDETENETENETETDDPETATENGTESETETDEPTENGTEEETESETDDETDDGTETDEPETETETDEETEEPTETETETDEPETEEGTETDEPETETETEEETEEPTETETGNPPLDEVIDHHSTRNADHSPVVGPYPTETDAAIVMFDDPGCPACADFDAEVMPDLREHADAGDLSIVWRGLGVIADWSEAALAIQWATYDRDAEAFWDLREHVFENRESIDGDEGAIDESISFLEANTSLDAGAIREEAASGASDERMAFDEDAAARSNVDATPYFHLFRDGEHRTEIRGYQEYQVFANTLEL